MNKPKHEDKEYSLNMSSSTLNRFSEIDRHFKKTCEAMLQIERANSQEDLRTAWEDFLSGFSRTIGRVIAIGGESKSSISWASKLKNASNKDDDGLVFMREARNAAEHGLSPFADFSDPSVSLGTPSMRDAFSLSGSSSVFFSDNIVNGVNTGTFTAKTEEGVLKSITGSPNVNIAQHPSKIILKEIYNPEKKKAFPVPQKIFGNDLDNKTPENLAKYALSGLQEAVEKLKDFKYD